MAHRHTTSAWYAEPRNTFLATPVDQIADRLAGRAAAESLEIQSAQDREWRDSINVLQRGIGDPIAVLRHALESADCEPIRDVILEFDFRRRGLRMDCVLIADGALFVIEFKRSKFTRADRDQVMNYAINLVEFHRVTREWCSAEGAIVVPVLSLTGASTQPLPSWPGQGTGTWKSLLERPMECGGESLREALVLALQNRRTFATVTREDWLNSPFSPSSSIIDATLSLYGNHDVSAIHEHAAPKAAIDASTTEIREHIEAALAAEKHHLVFLSGAPGAGKTLVGLDLVMRGKHAEQATFVTGNAPLVDVLNEALKKSYVSQSKKADSWTPTGYRRKDAKVVSSAATYKVVKAHNFLGARGHEHGQEDGRVLVFDEAQRTYEKGKVVVRDKLIDHEADLILSVQERSFPEGGSVVVALVGHNQAINRGERGIVAWLEAADRFGWSFSIGDETLQLAEITNTGRWAAHPNRRRLENGHLHQSMRYYRNAAVEHWVSAVLENKADVASAVAGELNTHGNTIWLTRDLASARQWARQRVKGAQRAGLIASGQARRLSAEGLFVDFKPNIADWMLAPSTDIRSSNALETVQNQYQIQGLELDYCIACWDLDLRRENDEWAAFKMSGSDWQRDKLLDVAKNGYRVILTRARQGLLIFIPRGDADGTDATRPSLAYEEIAGFLAKCGARQLEV